MKGYLHLPLKGEDFDHVCFLPNVLSNTTYIRLVYASSVYTRPLHTPPFSCTPGPFCSFEITTGRKQEHAQQVKRPQGAGSACSDCYWTLNSFCLQRTCWLGGSCRLARLRTPSLPPGVLGPTPPFPSSIHRMEPCLL